jgi:hypothetical protein
MRQHADPPRDQRERDALDEKLQDESSASGAERGTKSRPHVVVHADDRLRLQINEMLDRLSVTASAVTAMDLDRLRDELAVIFQTRGQEAQDTSLAAEAMLRWAERTRLEDIWRTTRADCVDERRRLEAQLKGGQASAFGGGTAGIGLGSGVVRTASAFSVS